MSYFTGTDRLTGLPTEILHYIVSFLGIADLIRLCRVPVVRYKTIGAIALRFRENAGVLCFASETGRYGLVSALLNCDSDPNMEWTPPENSSLREHPGCSAPLRSDILLAAYFGAYIEIDSEHTDDEIAHQGLPYCPDRWGDYPIITNLPPLDLNEVIVPRRHSPYPSWLPIHVAARKGDIEMVQLLLQHGALPDVYAWGVCRCHRVALEDRYMCGKKITPCCAHHQPPVTPLHVALCYRQTAVAKLLFDWVPDTCYQQPSRLNQRPVQVSVAPLWREEAPHLAAATGNVEFFSYLYNRDPNIIDRKDAKGLTPLFHAYANDQHDMVRWLLQERHADPNTLLGRGLPLVYVACLDGDFGFAKELIINGAEVLKPHWGTLPDNNDENESLWGTTLLELCATLHHSKNCNPGGDEDVEQKARTLVRQKAYGRQFDQSRLELMQHLLSTGAHISDRLLLTAAAQRSVPMLDLLAESGAVITENSALFYEVIESRRITFSISTIDIVPDPLPTLGWLSERVIIPRHAHFHWAMHFLHYCIGMSDPWRPAVFQWLLTQDFGREYALLAGANCIRFLQAAQRSHRLFPGWDEGVLMSMLNSLATME